MQTFIVSEQLARLICKMQNDVARHLRAHYTCDYYRTPEQAEIDFLDISQDDPLMLSYAPAKNFRALQDHPCGVFFNCGLRIKGRPAKAIGRIIPAGLFTQEQLTAFAEEWRDYQSPAAPEFTFGIVEGAAIVRAYSRDNYGIGTGLDLVNSCMADPAKADYLAIYAANPEQCKLAVLRDQRGRIWCRALLWYGVAINGQISAFPCRDRIYHGSLEARAAMIQHLSEYVNIYNSDNDISISLPDYSHCNYPYFDTFRFSDDSGTFSNDEGMEDVCWAYSSTGGGRAKIYPTDGREDCQDCGAECDEDDLTTCDNGRRLCCDCCGYVPRLHGYYPNSYFYYSEHHQENIPRREAVELGEDSDEYALRSACIRCEDGYWHLERDVITTEDGRHYHCDNEGEEFGRPMFFTPSPILPIGGHWAAYSEYYSFDAEEVVLTDAGRLILMAEAFTFDGKTYHEGETITTVEGDKFPAVRSDLFTVLTTIYGHSYHTAAK